MDLPSNFAARANRNIVNRSEYRSWFPRAAPPAPGRVLLDGAERLGDSEGVTEVVQGAAGACTAVEFGTEEPVAFGFLDHVGHVRSVRRVSKQHAFEVRCS